MESCALVELCMGGVLCMGGCCMGGAVHGWRAVHGGLLQTTPLCCTVQLSGTAVGARALLPGVLAQPVTLSLSACRSASRSVRWQGRQGGHDAPAPTLAHASQSHTWCAGVWRLHPTPAGPAPLRSCTRGSSLAHPTSSTAASCAALAASTTPPSTPLFTYAYGRTPLSTTCPGLPQIMTSALPASPPTVWPTKHW